MLIFSLHCQLFLLISGYYTICNIKITYQCKIIIVPEEGWFGQPKYSTPTKKSFYVVSTSACIFLLYASSSLFCAVVFAPACLQSTTSRRGKAAVYVVEDPCRIAVLLLHSIVY